MSYDFFLCTKCGNRTSVTYEGNVYPRVTCRNVEEHDDGKPQVMYPD